MLPFVTSILIFFLVFFRTKSKKKAFTKYAQQFANAEQGKEPAEVEKRINYIKKYADVVRVIAHSQTKLIKNLRMKKAHVMEIQINGGSVEAKVKYGKDLFEKEIDVHSIFSANECVDTIAVTRGHGFKGVVNRWGVTRLPRKTHRGLRKVACIGSWHPARIPYTVARAGQKGYHHRTEIHKKIYRMGKAITYDKNGNPKEFNASTEADLTKKNITPLGGFVGYGIVNKDYVMIKGTCPGMYCICYIYCAQYVACDNCYSYLCFFFFIVWFLICVLFRTKKKTNYTTKINCNTIKFNGKRRD